MNSKKIRFIDVGQGDCILVQPQGEWSIQGKDIFIDTGNGNVDISMYSNANVVDVVLTHSHVDHVNGLKYILGDITKNIDTIYLPLFANEIDLIAQAIINLKGFQYSENANEILLYFQHFHQCYKGLKKRIDYVTHLTNIVFLAEGMEVEGCLKCLNPPLHPANMQWVASIDLDSFFKKIDKLFVESFAEKIKAYFVLYFETNRDNKAYNEVKPSNREFMYSWILDRENSAEKQEARTNFILSFFIENLQLFSEFNALPDAEKAKQIKNNFQEASHDVCVVLMAHFDYQKILLTSDASTRVFERLIRDGNNIEAQYMKAPHHGSINNINRDILNAVSPKVVVISHGNKKFGRSKDSHPNIKTLRLLAEMDIRILCTRDIIKENTVVFSKKTQESFLKYDSLISID